LVSTSPGLIAAAHVLHRLSAPRHPPCALVLLIEKNTFHHYGVFKVRTDGRMRQSFKTQQRVGRGRRKFQVRPDIGRSKNNHQRAGQPTGVRAPVFPRKEVIQPQLPLRLPCYDFTPIINPTFDGSLPQGVRPPASGVADFRGVTGGVYKARERIHRGVADPRLLATPTSWRRVSASNPNRDRLFGIRSPSRVCSPLYRPM
jgi:hypothetical protein